MTLGLAVNHEFDNTLKRNLEFRRAELGAAVGSIALSYRGVVEVIFQQAINTDEVVELIATANESMPQQQARLRGKLYRSLYPVYRLLKARKIRVLQFVLEDGTSFLRFNRPDLFGDAIARERPMLAQVLAGKESGKAFENGRVYPGFRYAFPLKRGGEVIGAVDFSVAFDAFHDLLAAKEEDSALFTQFLVRKDLMKQVGHPSVASLFRDTDIHSAFLIEDESSSLRDINRRMQAPLFRAALDIALGRNAKVRAAMEKGEAFSLYQCLFDHECYKVILHPVKDSLDRPAGYIIGYFSGAEFYPLLFNHLFIFFMASLLIYSGGALFRRWLQSRKRLLTISENMAEGMYVMDGEGHILFANAAAVAILGYPAKEMIGRNGHKLFHFHSDEQQVRTAECPIISEPNNGKIFKSDKEVFRCRDGNLIRVDVTSSPLREEGEITGAVVLFRDITLEYQNRTRLQQSDIAFNNMVEAVLVADADIRIQAVNRAFTSITGYTEEEVLGRNPSLLASGQHDTVFYQGMWRSLLKEGRWEGEIWDRRKNGDVYPEWLNISVIKDEGGKVISYVSVFSDITEQRRKEKRLQELAYSDQLTGIHNRPAFMRMFDHALQQAKRHQRRVALLYLDLDRFKQVNDTLGHLVGDKLLQAVTLRLRESVRQEDEMARIGGDEFTLMLENIEQDEAPARVSRKILDCLRKPFEIDNKHLFISYSSNQSYTC